MQVDWAKELGIDVSKLFQEHPWHPYQLQMKRLHCEISSSYWEVSKNDTPST